MQRLLMGEVGSGKTVVALYAMLRAVEHGMQAALMAPTETLAEQHFATLQRLLGGEPVSAALLTGSTTGAPARRTRWASSRAASWALIVGTHALIEPDVRFRALAVAVVDEQHRFGVRQRAALEEKGAEGGGRRGADRRSAGAARAAHDRDADPAHARAGEVRGPRRERPARAAAGTAGDRDADRRGRARAGARVRGAARAVRCRQAGISSCARWSRSPTRPTGAPLGRAQAERSR